MKLIHRIVQALRGPVGRLYRRLQTEPSMVAAGTSAVIGWLTTNGFELTDFQQGLVWSVVALIFGAAVRQKVTPTSKLEGD